MDTQESGERGLFSSYFQPEKPENIRYVAIAIKSEDLTLSDRILSGCQRDRIFGGV